jgi:2-phosphosulfolactate phosphatase
MKPRVRVVPAVTSTPYTELLDEHPVVIVSDVIRATTTATTAIDRANRCVPVATVSDAFTEATRWQDALLAGEQQGEAVHGFDYGNSPAAMDKITGRTIILLSSSGTPVLRAAREAKDVYVGCLRNAATTARIAASTKRDVLFLAACTRGEFRDEDRLLAGWTTRHLTASGYEIADTLTSEILDQWGNAPASAMLQSPSVAFLRSAGFEDDLEFILSHVDDLSYGVRFADGELVRANE